MASKHKRFAKTLYDREWLEKRYLDELKSSPEIAAELGCDTSTVARALRRLGIPLRCEIKPPEAKVCKNCGKEFMVGGRGNAPRSQEYCSRHCHMMQQTPRATASHAPRPRKNLDTLHNEAWLRQKYLDEKVSMGQIASLCNCSVPSVRWALEKFGIPLRTLSEAKFGKPIGQGDRHTGDDLLSKRRMKAYEDSQARKREMVEAYGGKCACCGETEIAFLTLDHVGGGGQRDRLESGGSVGVFRRLKKLGWPKDGYRILCANCNMATKLGRTCPHQLKKESS